MGTTCLRVVNRWLSTYKVTKWFKSYCIELLRYIDSTARPSSAWWVSLIAMQSFTNYYTASTFKYIQGSTTLVSDQTAAFKKLIGTFIEDVGVEGPLTQDAILLRDPVTHVTSGSYSVSLSQVREYVCGLARCLEGLINEADETLQQLLLREIGSVYSVACDRIENICVLRNNDNSPFVDELSLPPVLPKELVKTRPCDFLRMVCEHSLRFEHHNSAVDEIVDQIADKHKELTMLYRTDPLLKDAIDSYQAEGRAGHIVICRCLECASKWWVSTSHRRLWWNRDSFPRNVHCRVRLFCVAMGEAQLQEVTHTLWAQGRPTGKTVPRNSTAPMIHICSILAINGIVLCCYYHLE